MSGDFDKSDNDKIVPSENAGSFQQIAMKKNFDRIEPLLIGILNRIRLASRAGLFNIQIIIWDRPGVENRMTGSEVQSLELELITRGFRVNRVSNTKNKLPKSYKSITCFGRGIARPGGQNWVVRCRGSFEIQWGL